MINKDTEETFIAMAENIRDLRRRLAEREQRQKVAQVEERLANGIRVVRQIVRIDYGPHGLRVEIR